MLTQERHHLILQHLSQQKVVTTQEFVSLLNASESTIRRDFQELEAEGLLKRIHGGVERRLHLVDEPNIPTKSLQYIEEKKLLAAAASATVADHETIFLDSGTTISQMIPLLATKNVQVVTNSIYHLEHLLTFGIPAIILGGQIKALTQAVIGPTCIEQLRSYHFDRAFLGTNGFHLEYGYTTPDPDEAAVKRQAMLQSQQTYVLADASKEQAVSFVRIADLAQATLLTTRLSEEFRSAYPKTISIQEVFPA